MNARTLLLLIATHLGVGVFGFALGIYALPILTAPPAPAAAEVEAKSSQASYTGKFKRNLKGSDAFHWGDGTVSISSQYITLKGSLAPGPDYKLYLSPEFVETEAEFKDVKSSMKLIGDVKTFENFVVAINGKVDPAKYNTVVVWCETFSEFITAATYR